MEQSQVSVRVDKKLKDEAYALMKERGETPTEVFRNVLEYYVKYGRPPVSKVIVGD